MDRDEDFEDEGDDSDYDGEDFNERNTSRYKERRYRSLEELPAFVSKLYEICTTQTSYVTWSDDNAYFTILDLKRFSDDLLSRYYSSNNFGSFVRQLNLYGFKKSKKDKSILEFSHPNFRKDRPELLGYVSRKSVLKDDTTPPASASGSHPYPIRTTKSKNVYQDVKTSKHSKSKIPAAAAKQIEDMKGDIRDMKESIEMLKGCVSDLIFNLGDRGINLDRNDEKSLMEGTDGRLSIGSIDDLNVANNNSEPVSKRRRFSSTISIKNNGRAPSNSFDFLLSPTTAPEENNFLNNSIFSLANYSAAPPILSKAEIFAEKNTNAQLKEMDLECCTVERDALCLRPFRLKITESGRQLSKERDIPPQWSTSSKFLSDWMNNMAGVDVIGRFAADGSFTQPISTKKVTWDLITSGEGKQNLVVPGFPPFEISRKINDPSSPLTLIIPQMILIQLTPTENPDSRE